MGPRAPPRRNTLRSNTGRNACNICAAPDGGFCSISGVMPNAERCAASAENFRSRYARRYQVPKGTRMRVKARLLSCCLVALSTAAVLSAAPPQQPARQVAATAVNTVERDGTTALHRAAQNNDLEVAEKLVRAGADVKAKNRYGVAPLSLACANGNAAMIELLLRAGADPNTTLPEGETALMTAAYGECRSAEGPPRPRRKCERHGKLARAVGTDVGGE